MSLRSLIVLSSSLIVSACTLGPDYQQPDMPPNAGYSDFAGSQPDLALPGVDVDHQWWESFDDPQLTSLVTLARRNNPDLAVAIARLDEARALRGLARSRGLPQLGAGGSAGRTQTSENGPGPAGRIPGIPLEQSVYDVSLDASWEIDLFGRVRRGVEAADARLDAAQAQRDDVMLVVTAEIARNYADLRSLQKQLAVARENADIAGKTLDLTTRLFDQGLASDYDVIRARAEARQIIAQQADLQSAIRSAIYRLGVLTGQMPDALSEDLLVPSEKELVVTPIPLGLPSELVRRRPDIRIAERQLAAANADIGVEVADLFPSFSLTGSYGFEATDLEDLFDSASEAWSYAGIVNWPLLGGGQRAQIDAAEARYDQADAQYRKAVLAAFEDVERSLAGYIYSVEKRKSLAAALDDREEALVQARLRYQNGLDDLFQLLEAQRQLTDLEGQIASADADILSSVVAVYKALGGGWRTGADAIDEREEL